MFIYSIVTLALRSYFGMLVIGALGSVYGFDTLSFIESAGVVWLASALGSMLSGTDYQIFKNSQREMQKKKVLNGLKAKS